MTNPTELDAIQDDLERDLWQVFRAMKRDVLTLLDSVPDGITEAEFLKMIEGLLK